MVHALQLAHNWLAQNGRLLNLHPNGEPAPVAVKLGADTHCAGWLTEQDDYASYHQANEAISQVVSQQLFAVERQATIPIGTYGESVAAVQNYLAESWTEAHMDELLIRRANDWLQSIITPKQVVLTEKLWVLRLRPLGSRFE